MYLVDEDRSEDVRRKQLNGFAMKEGRHLLDSELPFSGITSSVDDRNDDDEVVLN